MKPARQFLPQLTTALRHWRHLVALAALLATAQTSAQTASRGSIEGRVLNATNNFYLTNARVTIDGTDIVAFTNEAGEYRIANAPAGSVRLKVNYTGLASQVASIPVTSGGLVRHDFVLSRADIAGAGVIKLDAFTVIAERETNASAIALNEQRYSSNIKSVVSTDAYGESVDNNVGDFIKFLPGVQPEYVSGQVRSISLRGFDANFTPMLMDGQSIASTGAIAFSRSTELEAQAMSSVSRIEVHKVSTPDMSSEGLGGTVNMVTRTAFERTKPEFRFRVASQFEEARAFFWEKAPSRESNRAYQFTPVVSFGYENPLTKTLGIAVSGDWINTLRDFHRSNSTYSFSQAGAPGVTAATPFLRNYGVTGGPSGGERISLSGRVDWRPLPKHTITLRVNGIHSDSSFIQTTLNFDTGTAVVGNGFNFGPDYTDGGGGRGSTNFGTNTRHKYISSHGWSLSHKFEGRLWQTEAGINSTEGKTWYQVTEDGRFQTFSLTNTRALTIKYRDIAEGRPRDFIVTDAAGVPWDPYAIGNYRLNSVGETKENGSDFKHTAWFNLKRHLDFLPFPASLKIGTHLREQKRDRRGAARTWTYVGADGIAANEDNRLDTSFVLPDSRTGSYFNLPTDVQWPNSFKIHELYQANPQQFQLNKVSAEGNRMANSEHFNEVITAFYARTDLSFWHNRLQLVTGVRYEGTADKGEGRLQSLDAVWQRNAAGDYVRNAAGARIRRPEAGAVGSLDELLLTNVERGVKVARDYHHYTPSLNVAFLITENLKLAAGAAKTLGRPDIANIIPNLVINEDDSDPNAPGSISSRNTALRPWTSQNYGLSLEYYFGNNSSASLGVFRNDITGFFVTPPATILTPETLTELGLDQRFAGWTLTGAPFNSASTARVTGLETGFSQGLGYLGAWARPIRLGANITLNQVEGAAGSNIETAVPKIGNLTFAYSRRPVVVRVNWNYRGNQRRGTLSGLGPGAYLFTAPQQQLEASGEWQFSKHLSFSVTSRNLLKQSVVEHGYGSETPSYARFRSATPMGRYYTFGLKGTY